MDQVDMALDLFLRGHNCAQAVLIACGRQPGMDEGQMKRIACGFGAGCNHGSLCGALSGAAMALGLKYGEDEAKCKAHINALFAEMKGRYNGTDCITILGCDLTTKEGKRYFQEKNLFQDKCARIVADTTEYLQNMI